MNHLGDNFYIIPATVNTTMTTKQLKETLLATDGRIISCGNLWDIKSKRIGPGVYRVSLKESNL